MKFDVSATYSPRMLLLGGMLGTLFVLHSPDLKLWAACLLALPLAVWLLGRKIAHPVLPWLIGIFWLTITGDLLLAEMTGLHIATSDSTEFREKAILLSLAALLMVALGMRAGLALGTRIFAASIRRAADALTSKVRAIDHRRAIAAYFISLLFGLVIEQLAWRIPPLTQPLLALTLLKFASIYIVAIKYFEEKLGGKWLFLIATLEVANGSISFFSTFKEAIFVIIIAMAASRRRLSLFQLGSGLCAVALVIWMSLVWSVIKPVYRSVVADLTTQEKIAWMLDNYSNRDLDYSVALTDLSQRVGYTKFLAAALERESQGPLSSYDFYRSAITHVLTPRLLFPSKPALDDSKITSDVLGITIGSNTSIGLGYVTQAYIDFAFPCMLIPIGLIGMMLGLAVQYFLSRPVPAAVSGGLVTAVMFEAFAYAADIDKAFGGFITQLIVMVFVLRFFYPMIAGWLAGAAERSRVLPQPA